MTRSTWLAFTLALTLAASAWGQSVISAHSGTIHYTEGQVSLDGSAIQPKFGEFPEVKSGQVLATQDGRAEILLTPGVFLRLGENSSFKMISNQLSNTRLEVQSGEAMIEVGELLPDNAIAVVFHQGDISIAKRGLYRFDSDPAKLRVYEGEASVVSSSSDPTVVRKGHELIFGEAKLDARNFDAKETDEFYRWSARRDEYVAEANITSAKAVRDTNGGMGYAGGSCMGSGMGISSNVGTYYGNGVSSNVGTYSSNGTFSNVALNSGLGLTPGAGVNPAGVTPGVGMNPGMGSWAFNPWFGMFTYVPCSGTYFSPFGYGYFSPYAVGYLYGPYSPYAYGNGYGGARTGIANLGGIGRSGIATAAASPATSSSIGRAAGTTGGLGNGGFNSSRGGGGFGGGSGGGGASGGGGGLSGGGAHGGGASGGGGKH